MNVVLERYRRAVRLHTQALLFDALDSDDATRAAVARAWRRRRAARAELLAAFPELAL